MNIRNTIFAGGVLVTSAVLVSNSAYALNYFELEVYPYATPAKGETEVENTTTYTPLGSKLVAAPDNHAGSKRTTFEVSRGVTDKTEISIYSDLYQQGHSSWHSAADRIHMRTRFFEKGQLPVDLALYAEMEFPKNSNNNPSGSHAEFDFRGIIEKDSGKWTFDLNPMFEKVVSGTNTAQGWEFHYAAGAIYRLNERWHPRLDFFGDIGRLQHFDAKQNQTHLISPGVDIRLKPNLKLSASVGFGLTGNSEQRILHTNLEWEFY